MTKQKIRIRLKAYDHRVLDQSAKRIVETAERSGAHVVGPVPLPTKLERFTIRRSAFIDKDSHEHYEIRTHNRLIDVLDPDSKTIDMLMRLNLPAGVEMVMPGDNVNMMVELIVPVALEQGSKFAIREGGLTVGAGVITKILD